MKYLIERNKYYNVGDIVLIEYWYNFMITEVCIKEIKNNKYVVSHNTENSKIKNAPDEILKSNDIICKKQGS
jgi:hypothetical protein